MQQQEEFQSRVATLLEVAMFENWLRFYFIKEVPDSDELKLELPEKAMERIRELYPALYPLAEALDGKPIDFETSRNAVLHHVLNHVEGTLWPQGVAQSILQSATFQTKLQLFHIWEQVHEDQLDRGFSEFGAWKQLFARWLETPGARELGKKLMSGESAQI